MWPFTLLLVLVVVNASENSSDASPPRWEAMVINLDRRPDRLQRFAAAVSKTEPWIFSVGDGKQTTSTSPRLCRVPGRDGRELARPVVAQSKQSRRSSFLSRSDPTRQLNPAPLHLNSTQVLVAQGWISQKASESAAAAHAEWPNMTVGGIGLYLGHAAAWRRVVERDLDYGLIFEDDLTLFAPNFATQVRAVLEGREKEAFSYPTDWDFLYLQRCNDPTWRKQRPGDFNPAGPRHLGAQSVGAAHSAQVPISFGERTSCTGGYIITRQGAKKLMAGALPAQAQLDWQLSEVPYLQRAALSPPVAQCEEVIMNDGTEVRDTDVQVEHGPAPVRRSDTVKRTGSKEIPKAHAPPIPDCAD